MADTMSTSSDSSVAQPALGAGELPCWPCWLTFSKQPLAVVHAGSPYCWRYNCRSGGPYPEGAVAPVNRPLWVLRPVRTSDMQEAKPRLGVPHTRAAGGPLRFAAGTAARLPVPTDALGTVHGRVTACPVAAVRPAAAAPRAVADMAAALGGAATTDSPATDASATAAVASRRSIPAGREAPPGADVMTPLADGLRGDRGRCMRKSSLLAARRFRVLPGHGRSALTLGRR